jgi:hypothetical protein
LCNKALRSLTRLSPGMELNFAGEIARFDKPAQLHLDG